MPRKIPRALWIVLPLAYLLYFYHLGATGLLGPDEPRYASIAREMARSGDWITPRLWGQPWFEKPALLYWMTGAAFRLGIGPDLAPRLPVALMAVGFLVFYWWILRREFGARAAWFATLILGCCGGWLVYSQVGVPDMPVAAAFSAAMLLALPWIGRRETRYLPVAAALLGLAVLAKGPVALVLAAPLCLRFRNARDLVRPRVVAPFLVVALPWYLLCYLRNGNVFLHDFFVVHNFERFTSNALMHAQPWWFYLPVLAGLLLPWFPLLLLLGRRAAYRDPRRLFLLAWVVFGMVFFTAATNKLPGYLLPLLPAAAALMGLALDASRSRPRRPLAGVLRPAAGGVPHGRPDASRGAGGGPLEGAASRISSKLAAGRRSGRRGVAPGEPRAPAGRGAADRRRRHRGKRLSETRGGAGTGPHGFRPGVLARDFRPRG